MRVSDVIFTSHYRCAFSKQIYLRPKETVYVPFRYQGFEIGKEVSSGPSQFFKPTSTVLQTIKASSNHGTIKPKVVKVGESAVVFFSALDTIISKND